ncbi:hypothetical protein H8F21_14015 [Pseudomonas sp. P66]|uniref:Morphogenetic protein n=1 Tax=Pseudomonas arcuscaelestis TaxID=2710591 RepID=A0ABS2BYX1_9PSED|nr:hypothetical protein [Pseudomonas arcuscaelestis]MBM5458680.1 hypothetical protein [Pseudomonas arcuscaelestis]
MVQQSRQKEHAIEFTGPKVRATLAGACSVTRRIVKKAAAQWLIDHSPDWVVSKAYDLCPFGQPGDYLWVREAWSQDFSQHYPYTTTWYRADDDRAYEIVERDGIRGIWSPEHSEHVPFRWHSSRCMPRKASRITLRMIGLKVERLHDITESQIIAEGVRPMRDGSGTWIGREGPGRMVTPWLTAREAFIDLWEARHGPGSWAANPWVWAIEFSRA